MSHRLKIKAPVLAIFIIASVVAMGFVLSNMQTNISLNTYRETMEQELEDLPGQRRG